MKKIINQTGFTLLEVMIAITILAFIMISVVSIQNNSQEAKDRVVTEDQNFLQVETAFARIEWDFSQIYTPLYFSHEMRQFEFSNNEENEAFNRLNEPYTSNDNFSFLNYDGLPVPSNKNPEKSELIFFTMSNRRKIKNSKASHYAWVRYELESPKKSDSKEGDNLVRRVFTKNPFTSERIEWEDVKGQVLLRNVTKLNFEFWNPASKKWVDNFDLIKNGKNIIYGLKVKMKWIDIDEIENEYVRVFRPLFPRFSPEDMYQLRKPESGQPSFQ